MARIKDLVGAKDELSARLLVGRPRRVAAMPERTLKAAGRSAGSNVHAVGVGRKLVKGNATRTLCVRFYVVAKLVEAAIPRRYRLPKRVAGLPTDVIESPPAFAHQALCSTDRTLRQRPLVGGTSAAHYEVNRATLGCFCRSLRKREANRLYMLSNNHAFADLNQGQVGDAILQPSPGDGGGSSPDGDLAGTLARFVPIRWGGRKTNRVDAAIAEVAPRVGVHNEICMIGPLLGVTAATEALVVRKHGRTSGYTEGVVVDISYDATVSFGSAGDARFVNQFRVDPAPGYSAFVLPGDSGSVVVAKHAPLAVGLYFAGGADGYGVVNPIADVCSELAISIP